jgi:hypothetical protein
MTFKVWNPTDKTVWLKSFDGDSVGIGPKAKGVMVANKFGWQVPKIVKTRPHTTDEQEKKNDPNRIVKGRMPLMARKPRKSLDKNGKPFVNNRTAKQMREHVAAKKAQRELAAQRAAFAAENNISVAALNAGAPIVPKK